MTKSNNKRQAEKRFSSEIKQNKDCERAMRLPQIIQIKVIQTGPYTVAYLLDIEKHSKTYFI